MQRNLTVASRLTAYDKQKLRHCSWKPLSFSGESPSPLGWPPLLGEKQYGQTKWIQNGIQGFKDNWLLKTFQTTHSRSDQSLKKTRHQSLFQWLFSASWPAPPSAWRLPRICSGWQPQLQPHPPAFASHLPRPPRSLVTLQLGSCLHFQASGYVYTGKLFEIIDVVVSQDL